MNKDITSQLSYLILSFALAFLMWSLKNTFHLNGFLVFAVWTIGSLVLCVYRLKSLNENERLAYLSFIPLINLTFFYYLIFGKSDSARFSEAERIKIKQLCREKFWKVVDG